MMLQKFMHNPGFDIEQDFQNHDVSNGALNHYKATNWTTDNHADYGSSAVFSFKNLKSSIKQHPLTTTHTAKHQAVAQELFRDGGQKPATNRASNYLKGLIASAILYTMQLMMRLKLQADVAIKYKIIPLFMTLKIGLTWGHGQRDYSPNSRLTSPLLSRFHQVIRLQTQHQISILSSSLTM